MQLRPISVRTIVQESINSLYLSYRSWKLRKKYLFLSFFFSVVRSHSNRFTSCASTVSVLNCVFALVFICWIKGGKNWFSLRVQQGLSLLCCLCVCVCARDYFSILPFNGFIGIMWEFEKSFLAVSHTLFFFPRSFVVSVKSVALTSSSTLPVHNRVM